MNFVLNCNNRWYITGDGCHPIVNVLNSDNVVRGKLGLQVMVFSIQQFSTIHLSRRFYNIQIEEILVHILHIVYSRSMC
jgi:hypothetical protein